MIRLLAIIAALLLLIGCEVRVNCPSRCSSSSTPFAPAPPVIKTAEQLQAEAKQARIAAAKKERDDKEVALWNKDLAEVQEIIRARPGETLYPYRNRVISSMMARGCNPCEVELWLVGKVSFLPIHKQPMPVPYYWSGK